MNWISEKENKQGISNQRKNQGQNSIVQNLGQDDVLWTNNRIVVNKNPFSLTYKTLASCANHGEHKYDPI